MTPRPPGPVSAANWKKRLQHANAQKDAKQQRAPARKPSNASAPKANPTKVHQQLAKVKAGGQRAVPAISAAKKADIRAGYAKHYGKKK